MSGGKIIARVRERQQQADERRAAAIAASMTHAELQLAINRAMRRLLDSLGENVNREYPA